MTPPAATAAPRSWEGTPEGSGLRIAVVVSRFNEEITQELCDGAVAEATERGVSPADLDIVWVPGAFELPLAAQRLAAGGRYDGIACLGVVVQGETPHFDFVCQEAARGIGQVARDFDLPVAFGVVTTNTMQQAWARAGRAPTYKGGRPRTSHKGREAMETVLRMATLLPRIGARAGIDDADASAGGQ